MELSTHHDQEHHQEEEDVDIPIPINSSYSGHMIHHHHHLQLPHNHILPISSAPQSIHSNGSPPPITTTAAAAVVVLDHLAGEETAVVPYKKPAAVIKYRECLKNHAASMGGNATDGCGEFMPSGEEGTIEALTCSACNCHRNFHRKDHMEGDNNYFHIMRQQRKLLLTQQQYPYHKTPDGTLGYPTSSTGALIPSRSAAAAPHQMIMSYNMGGPILSESDDQQDQDGGGNGARPAHSNHNYNNINNNNNNQYYHHNHNNRGGKKRFRTKFSQEQKEKMLNFAEKVGWKIQKQEESIVQQFCQEIGVKRRVLKVWMHNNKHSLAIAKKNSTINTTTIDAHDHHQTNSLS